MSDLWKLPDPCCLTCLRERQIEIVLTKTAAPDEWHCPECGGDFFVYELRRGEHPEDATS
jgi:hypothetical protein